MTRPNTEYTMALRAFRVALLRHYLALGSVNWAARHLGVDPRYLRRLKRTLGIEGRRG